MWTDEQKAAAIAELRNDPEDRGYAAMSDAEVAADMALEVWQTPPASIDIPAASIAARITMAEVTAWRTHAHPDVVSGWLIYSGLLAAGGGLRGDKVLEQVAALGPAGLGVFSAASAAAVSGLIPLVSRWELLKLPRMKVAWVATVRGWING